MKYSIDDIEPYMMGRHKLKPEMALQCALMSWLDAKHPSIKSLTMVSAGGMWTNIRQAALMKSSGYKKGTPDIMIAIPQNGYHGLFIELKTEKGRPSKEQKDLIKTLNVQGYSAHICRGWNSAQSTIENYCALWILNHKDKS
jgi:hypothetical protein